MTEAKQHWLVVVTCPVKAFMEKSWEQQAWAEQRSAQVRQELRTDLAAQEVPSSRSDRAARSRSDRAAVRIPVGIDRNTVVTVVTYMQDTVGCLEVSL